MINNPAEVSHKERLPVSPHNLEQPEVIMTCQHIWCERLTASPPNRASSGHHSPGRPPILSSSCSLLLYSIVTEHKMEEAWEVWGLFQQSMCTLTVLRKIVFTCLHTCYFFYADIFHLGLIFQFSASLQKIHSEFCTHYDLMIALFSHILYFQG